MIKPLARLETFKRPRLMLALPAAAAVAAVLAACGSSGSASSSSSGTSNHAVASVSSLKTAKIGGATVLTNAGGFAVYSFGPDTSTMSNCNGTCAQNWPPVKGPASASGVKGTFGTIKRSNGSTQATFDGHPLYTFVGDTAPGEAKGNGLNADGGLWHEVTDVRERSGRRVLIGLRQRRLRVLTETVLGQRGGLTDDRAGKHDQAGNDKGSWASRAGARKTAGRLA